MYKRISCERRFNCNFCLQPFSSKLKLKRHQQIHKEIKHFLFNYNNLIEFRKLLTLKNVRKHVYSRDKQLNCFLCCKQLRTSGDKNNHLKAHFGMKFQPQENVENILQENSLSPNLQMQSLVIVENRFSCDKCFKKFSRQDHLKRHQLIHTGKKPFECNVCDMKFTQKI